MELLRVSMVMGLALVVGVASTVACSSDNTSSNSSGGTNGTSGGTSGNTSGGTSGNTSGGTSGNTDGGGNSSGSTFKDCSGETTGTDTCTQAEKDTYSSCVMSSCTAEGEACYGSGWKNGTFAGPCGAYMTCTQKCECNDTACYQACGTPDQACTTCLQTYGTCIQGKCPAPACFGGGGGGGGKTCADLQACCAKIADATKKTQCTQVYDAIKASGDAACNGAYSQYAADCP